MKLSIRTLLLEDSPADAELILTALANAGIGCDSIRVETREDFLAAIENNRLDLILSDMQLPSFDGFSALKIAHEKLPEVPFIFVSGALGEEMAIETLKNGATDYVLKHRLSRLVPAVRRAIEEASERAARQAAEKSRFEAESLFQTLFEQVTLGVAIAGLDGRIIKGNPALEKMLGYGPGELSGTLLAHLTDPGESAAQITQAEQELHGGGRTSYELENQFVRRDGTKCRARMVVSRILGDDAAPRFSVHLIEDITERKEMEQRFLQAQKMEVAGRLAAGFAHDFNNLLTIINGYSELLLKSPAMSGPENSQLQAIYNAGERATILVKRLLTFSRHQVQQPGRLDLSSVLAGMDPPLRLLIGRQVTLTMRLEREAGLIEIDQNQIEQIIMNLAINARDAMPGGGELIIETAKARLDEVSAGRLGLSPEVYVVLDVTDTGHGMDEQTKSRIFEPFFTTKPVGKGTGLGLWMVREAILQSHGAITVESEPGHGTTFRICLPRASAEAESLSNLAVAASAGSAGGTETILVADDNDVMREFVHAILESAGYRVLVAQDGAEALAVALGEENEIHLLLTDIEMPNIQGTELAVRLAETRPETRVLYISGHAERPKAVEETPNAVCGFVAKPFASAAMLQRVREILDAPPRASILVVDDDPEIRSFLLQVLQPSGCLVREAANGLLAMQSLRQNRTDLLIIDLVMPDQDGLATIKAVKKEFPHLQTIAMSGGFGEQYLHIAEKLGAQEVLLKPFGAAAIAEMVRRLLARRSAAAVA